jgi:hypothetical protein
VRGATHRSSALHRRVDQERDGDAEAHLLEGDRVAHREAPEDGDDDERRAGDQPCCRLDAEGDEDDR